MQASAREGMPVNRGLWIPVALGVSLLVLATLPVYRTAPAMTAGVVGAGALLLVWSAILFTRARAAGRHLALDVAIKKQHWVQACTQIAIYLYWGWYVRTVYAFFPLIFVELLFAYGVAALLNWSRRDRWELGFGPVPIILSINLFLVFRPEWFHWQFVVILLGYLGKEFIRWERDGRSAHIVNPSSFPLAVFALGLLVLGATDATLGAFIAQSQFIPPHMYAFVFLVSLPVQILFGVARMTLVAVLAMLAISFTYFEVTGTYMFRDAFISLPVFLGMHLLITDPSTSPRTELGQVGFGILYAVGITLFFFLLEGLGLPAFYEKLLPVPLLNLTVRRLDILARSETLRRFDPGRLGRTLAPLSRNVAYTSAWVGVFALFSTVKVFGDHHPGQYLPFWEEACQAGSTRACDYRAFMTFNYCNRESGWACNEFGLLLARRGDRAEAVEVFRRSCDLGFDPGCQNARRTPSQGGAAWARSQPTLQDLPIVLRGSKGPVRERDPQALLAMACSQGWDLCAERAASGG